MREKFTDKFKTCVRTRPILCNKTGKDKFICCSVCEEFRKKTDKRTKPYRCQQLGSEFFARESTKPLFKKHSLLTVHNIYRTRCIMETLTIMRTHTPISIHDLFNKSKRKADYFITPQPSNSYIYNGPHLWNKFIEQSNLRSKLNSGTLNSIACLKSKLKQSILNAQESGDHIKWNNDNFTSFLPLP